LQQNFLISSIIHPFMSFSISDIFHGPNGGWVLDLYEQYQRDPNSVDAKTRAFFVANGLSVGSNEKTNPSDATPNQAGAQHLPNIELALAVTRFVQSIRSYGYLLAELDPLGRMKVGDPELDPKFHGFEESDLFNLPANLVDSPAAQGANNAAQAIQNLRKVYEGSIGHDWGHIRNPEQRDWLRAAAESRRFHPDNLPTNRLELLKRLTQVEVFESFLNRMFPGKTRFSIEGLDTMIVILDEVIQNSVKTEISDVLIGMAHRGRLNVLAHTLNKSYRQILSEFKDYVEERFRELYQGWQGDVKYHKGAARQIEGNKLRITLVPNPSHLEHVNPVVTGMARAAGTKANQPGKALFDRQSTLPIIIHGDAAFTGQGIVAETLNMSGLRGYRTGGTLHIIANNQIGFTTDTSASRSTRHASDIAKGYGIPVLHVNADDPEACLEVARIAHAYMNEFEADFLINLIGYRRYGHNEGDEPRFTQPRMYQIIETMPTVREKYAKKLQQMGLISAENAKKLVNDKLQVLNNEWELVKNFEPEVPQFLRPEPGSAKRVETAVPAHTLQALNQSLLQVPDGFTIHPRLQRILDKRAVALDHLDDKNIDWGTAEALAFASIIADGTPCRLTGEDVWRGTFSHRHAVLRDINNGAEYIPLHNIPQAQASFEIRNSPLSENATVGFEIGYCLQAPDRLVIWEAQYGDFVTGAQVVIDEFLVSGRDKWGMLPSLVMLLPHGHEGGGPDHSTGRPERFLQMAADLNLRLANPTTPAQLFHLLRRQAKLLQTDPLPLIVLSPKLLLRHPLAVSSLRELAEGRWNPVLNDEIAQPKQVTRLLLCSGKVFVELMGSEERAKHPETAIVRLEQLYPVPTTELSKIFEAYPHLKQVFWVQEEPRNMGAWEFLRDTLQQLAGEIPVEYIGRPVQSSPSEGGAAWHKRNQERIIHSAFND
jgi:2-oxoglutarate dehydrogenase E1 component